MHVTAAGEATDELIVRVPVETDEDGNVLEREPERVSFSENNIAQVKSHVGEHLVESDRYHVSEHTSDGGSS